MTWAYFYLMKQEPGRVREVAPQHAQYWRELGAPGWRGGPFTDRSGGLIVFNARSEKAAEEAVANDPCDSLQALAQIRPVGCLYSDPCR